MTKTIYLSGKIAGLARVETIEKFKQGKRELFEMINCPYYVINPMELVAVPNMKWADYIIRDLLYLAKCDAIYMLSDWQDSPGARVEHEFAKGLGIEIIYQKQQDDER